jgi:hypothetical protein
MISFESTSLAAHHVSRWTLDAAIAELKAAVWALDRAALRNGGEVPADLASELQDRFRALCVVLNEHLGDSSPRGQEAREALGAHIQRELLPYLLLTENGERWYAKPRGYAGDFLSIEWIYRNRAGGAAGSARSSTDAASTSRRQRRCAIAAACCARRSRRRSPRPTARPRAS